MLAKSNRVRPGDMDLIADSFSCAFAQAHSVGSTFYEILFRRYPALRNMFSEDLGDQPQKMIDTLQASVGAIGYPEVLRPIVEDLARRHVRYGVGEEHYKLVGETLVVALIQSLDPDEFDLEAQAAWQRAYGRLSAMMVAAAYPKTDD